MDKSQILSSVAGARALIIEDILPRVKRCFFGAKVSQSLLNFFQVSLLVISNHD